MDPAFYSAAACGAARRAAAFFSVTVAMNPHAAAAIREPQPVGWLVADPADLAAQHRVLVPEHQQLGVFGRLGPGQQQQTAEHVAHEQVGDRQDHSVIISARKTPSARPDRVIEPHSMRDSQPAPRQRSYDAMDSPCARYAQALLAALRHNGAGSEAGLSCGKLDRDAVFDFVLGLGQEVIHYIGLVQLVYAADATQVSQIHR
jgi:hypothetical protein